MCNSPSLPCALDRFPISAHPFSTIRHSKGPADFRNLVYSYLNREFTADDIHALTVEIANLTALFESNATDVRPITTSYKYFAQISALLRDESADSGNDSLALYQVRQKKWSDCNNNDPNSRWECRFNRAKAIFEEFREHERDYYSYVAQVSKPLELIHKWAIQIPQSKSLVVNPI